MLGEPAIALRRGREFRYGDTGIAVVEDNRNPHIAANFIGAQSHDVGEEPRAFIQFDNRDDIRHVAFEAWMVHPVIDDEAVDAPRAFCLAPDEIAAETMSAALRGWKPEFAACVALRQQKAVRLRGLPERNCFRARTRSGPFRLGV